MQGTNDDVQILVRLAVAYAIYLPFWVVVGFIHWYLVEEFDRQSYITYCLRCGYPILFAISIFVILKLAYKTNIRVWRNPTLREFAIEVRNNVLMLLVLILFLIGTVPIVTFTERCISS